jgi:hypothetical protein
MKIMKKFTTKLKLTAIMASLAGMTFISPVSANVIATSILDISNLKFTDTQGNTLNNITDIDIRAGNNFGNLSANLFSVAGDDSSAQNENIFLSPGVLNPTGGSFDGDQVCQGDCMPRAENDYTFRVVPPSATTSYSYADNILTGTSIDLDINGDGIIDIFAGVNASTIAEVMLNTSDTGNATSTTGTNFTFDFLALQDQEVLLSFDYLIQALAFVEPGSLAPSSATAGVSWNISLTDGITTQTYNPNQLNLSSSRTDIFSGLTNQNSGGQQSLQFSLTGGTLYQVSITHQNQVNASSNVAQVPEPNMLALLGLGLAAFAVPAIRRKLY